MAYDYNPDKEKHRDHTYIVSKATTDPSLTSLPSAKGDLKFDKEGRFAVSDPGLAHEIMTNTSAADAVVTRVNKVNHADRGHRYFFGQMPDWKGRSKKKAEEQDAEQEETQDNAQAETQDQEEPAQPGNIYTNMTQVYDKWEETLVSWPYAGGLATDGEE